MYNVYLNDEKHIENVKDKKITLKGLTPETKYDLQVSKVENGVESELTKKKSFTTLKEVKPLSVEFPFKYYQILKNQELILRSVVQPIDSSDKEVGYRIVKGHESIELIDGVIKSGDLYGSATIECYMKNYPEIKSKVLMEITVLETIYEIKELNIVLPNEKDIFYANVEYNMIAEYVPNNTTQTGFVVDGEYENVVLTEDKILFKKPGQYNIKFKSKFNDKVFKDVTVNVVKKIDGVNVLDTTLKVNETKTLTMEFVPREVGQNAEVVKNILIENTVEEEKGKVEIVKNGSELNVKGIEVGTYNFTIKDGNVKDNPTNVGTFNITVEQE